MTSAERAAYIMAQATAAQAEIAGMVAENTHHQLCNGAVRYRQPDFAAVIEKHGLDHNAVLGFFMDGV